MEKIKRRIEMRKNILYTHMENDEYVSPDMLDEALAVIAVQNQYIEELEMKLDKANNYIEDMQIYDIIEERDKHDNGERYSIEDLESMVKE